MDARAPHPRAQPAHRRCWSRSSTLYLDVFRNRLSKERVRQTRIEATATAAGDPGRRTRGQRAHPRRPCPRSTGTRLRLFAPMASWSPTAGTCTGPTYELKDPNTAELDQGRRPGARPRLQRHRRREVARRVRRAAGRPARRRGPRRSRARQTARPSTAVRNAPDLTPVISAAVPIDGGVLLATDNDRAFTRTVRSQRGADRRRDGGR